MVNTKAEEKGKESKNEDQKDDYQALIRQISQEYTLAYDYMKPKIDEWGTRLKLYNNQKRDKSAIGDPLLFTIHQTVLASLYDDRLSVKFMARNEGDEEIAENLNSLAIFDYKEMHKTIIDYVWDWDASFFGRGLVLLNEFDRDKKCPAPENIDIMTWIRDPRATSVNGDMKGRGEMKFGGREIRLSKKDLEEGGYSNYEDLQAETTSTNSLIDNNKRARREAQGLSESNDKLSSLDGDTASYRALEWFTIWKGKKTIVTLADNRKRVIKLSEIKGDRWPILDRALYPIAHDWDGVSIPDLVEDKQRARAIVQNLALRGIKFALHPVYLYNRNIINNRNDLNVDFNKHIGVDGNPSGAVQQIERQTLKSETNWILDLLDTASQKATATPDIQQGAVQQDKRTATELNMLSSKVDTRYSLTAKIFGWSEERFWQQWYQLYKKHFKKGIDDKIIRIVGALGAQWRGLSKDSIVADEDPDVMIESKVLSEAKKFNQLQKYRLFLKDIATLDPLHFNKRMSLRRVGELSGMTKEEVEQVLPPSFDEMDAEEENENLSENKKERVNIYDDDFVHIHIHNKAKDTKAKEKHIESHRKALMLKRQKKQFDFANQQNMEAQQASPESLGGKTSMMTEGSQSPISGGSEQIRSRIDSDRPQNNIPNK